MVIETSRTRRAAVAGRRAVRLALCASIVSCTFALPPPSAEDVSPGGPDIVLEIRGAWAPRVERLRWSPDQAPKWLDKGDGPEQLQAWRLRCRQLSVQAFDTLRQATGGRLPREDYDRWSVSVLPSPDGSLAVILGPGGAGSSCQLVEVDTGAQRPWPAALQSHVVLAKLWSGDGRLLALDVLRDDRRDDRPHRLVILDVSSGTILRERDVYDYDLAWSEDGAYMALLVRTMQDADGLFDKLGAAMGHGPGFVSDFNLVILDVATGDELRLPVYEHVRSGAGRLLWDPRAVGWVTGDISSGAIPPGESR